MFTKRIEGLNNEIQNLKKLVEREQLNALRSQQKLEQDFDYHKQLVVNDCGRHIEGT